MNPKPSLPQRRAMRLRGYDYSQPGAYFVSICAQHRKCLFGTIIDGQMRLNEIGEIVVECWSRIPQHFPSVELGEYVIMPNHIHGIIALNIVGARSPRPIGEEQSISPTVGARSPRPIGEEQSISPTVGTRSPRPIGEEQSISPTVGTRSPRPIGEEQSISPTVGTRSPRPIGEEQSISPTVGTRSPRPIGEEQSISPTVGTRSPRPIGEEQSISPTVGTRSPRPIGEEQSISPTVGTRSPRPSDNSPSLGKIVAYFKYQSTKHINQHHNMPGTRIWQRNYYDHVIRDDTDLQRIRRYIQDNPMKWALDQLHPDNPSRW